MKLRWAGGPLDGAEDEIAAPTMLWIGPDPSDPNQKVLVYLWHSDGTYRYSQAQTDKANALLAQGG